MVMVFLLTSRWVVVGVGHCDVRVCERSATPHNQSAASASLLPAGGRFRRAYRQTSSCRADLCSVSGLGNRRATDSEPLSTTDSEPLSSVRVCARGGCCCQQTAGPSTLTSTSTSTTGLTGADNNKSGARGSPRVCECACERVCKCECVCECVCVCKCKCVCVCECVVPPTPTTPPPPLSHVPPRPSAVFAPLRLPARGLYAVAAGRWQSFAFCVDDLDLDVH